MLIESFGGIKNTKMLYCKPFLLSFFLVFVKSEERHCSNYDFEEKMLEKMVRMEFQMQRMKTEMEKSVKTVKDTIKEVSSALVNSDEKLKEVDDSIDKLEKVETSILDNLRTRQQKLGQDINDKFTVLENKTSELIKAKLTELRAVIGQVVTPTVAFKVRLNADMDSVSGMVIVFPDELFNEGDAYSKETGKFTAPTNGTYLFSIAFCVWVKKYFRVCIMVDGVKYTASVLYGDVNHSCSTADTVAVLKAGQSVWVQSSSSSGTVMDHHSSYRWNTFSGTLIHS